MTGSISDRDKKLLPVLIMDCMTYHFKTRCQQIDYVSKRLGRHISDDTFRRYLKQITNGEFARQWYYDYTKNNYLIEHQQLLQTGYFLRAEALKLYDKEIQKEESIQDKRFILMLWAEIRESSKMIAELSAGVPIVSQIDQRMQQYEDRIQEMEERLRGYQTTKEGGK